MMGLRRWTVRWGVIGLAAWLGLGLVAAAQQQPAPREAAPLTTGSAVQAPPAKEPGYYLKLETGEGGKPGEVHIGDPIELRLEVRDRSITPGHVSDIFINVDPEKWHIEKPFRREPASRDGKQPECWRAVVRPFETGKLEIPPLKVAWRDAAGQARESQTTTATLNVLALRSATVKDFTLIPMRDPAEIPRDWTWLWNTLGILLVCGLLAWAALRWWLRRGHPAPESRAPELPPGLWALRELDYRSRLPVCQNGPAKGVFSHVSEVIRLYLGRRYGVAAIDMTTYECMQALAAIAPGDEVLRWVREFLEECDLVKFTTIEPSRERWKTIWHDARLIVKATTPPEELGETPVAREAKEVAT